MNKARFAAAMIVLCLCCAVPAGIAAENPGVLDVRVTDHREAIGDFAKLVVTFEDILISLRPGMMFWRSRWQRLRATLPSIDLTHYTGRRSATVFRGPVGPGSFEAIHLKIKSIEGTLKKKTGASAEVKNRVGPIKLAFATSTDGETIIIMDLAVMDLSDHPPQAYELGVKGYELHQNGKLVDKVPPG